jgi:hypothetical protein
MNAEPELSPPVGCYAGERPGRQRRAIGSIEHIGQQPFPGRELGPRARGCIALARNERAELGAIVTNRAVSRWSRQHEGGRQLVERTRAECDPEDSIAASQRLDEPRPVRVLVDVQTPDDNVAVDGGNLRFDGSIAPEHARLESPLQLVERVHAAAANTLLASSRARSSSVTSSGERRDLVVTLDHGRHGPETPERVLVERPDRVGDRCVVGIDDV